jgi:hypothetical protein
MGVDYLSLIDRSKLHYKRSDVTPIFAEPAAFAALVDDMIAPWHGEKIDRVVGTDALGFVVGTAIAWKLGVGFVPVRKGGKLPVAKETCGLQRLLGCGKNLRAARAALAGGHARAAHGRVDRDGRDGAGRGGIDRARGRHGGGHRGDCVSEKREDRVAVGEVSLPRRVAGAGVVRGGERSPRAVRTTTAWRDGHIRKI